MIIHHEHFGKALNITDFEESKVFAAADDHLKDTVVLDRYLNMPFITSQYRSHLSDFLKYFRRDQIIVFNSNTAFGHSRLVMDSIAKFLAIEPVRI